MTEKSMTIKKRPRFSVISIGIFALFLFALFLRNNAVAALYIKKGISVCIETLIPSLFPYLVLSDILLALSLPSLLERPLRKPMQALFGVSGAGACAFILGILCGFPLGAKSAVDLYDRGEISKSECEKLLAFCNIPSLTFTVGVVGGAVFGSNKTGFIFWLLSVICAIIAGMLNKFFYRKSPSLILESKAFFSVDTEKSSGSIFVRAIERSAKSTLLICAYVVFFSALTGTVSFLLEGTNLTGEAKCLIFGAFELTNGINNAAGIASTKIKAALCAFFIGWSGFSVHLQIFSICEGRSLKFTNYLLQKLFQGILCAVLALLLFSN